MVFISSQFAVLNEFPSDWKTRAKQKCYGQLTVIVPCVADLLISQLKRGEPRDSLHAQLVRQLPEVHGVGRYPVYKGIARFEYGRLL